MSSFEKLSINESSNATSIDEKVNFEKLINESSNTTSIDSVNNFHEDGYITIENVIDVNLIEKLATKAMANFNEVMSIIETKNLSIGVGIKEGFKEITQRHLHRFEMPYKTDDPAFDDVFNNNNILTIVKQILGDDAIVVNRSVVISLSGASDQGWHCDGPHLSTTEYLPCHCLNVFIPLVDTNHMTGPTEFRPSSQCLTRDFSKMYLAGYYYYYYYYYFYYYNYYYHHHHHHYR